MNPEAAALGLRAVVVYQEMAYTRKTRRGELRKQNVTGLLETHAARDHICGVSVWAQASFSAGRFLYLG